MENIEYPLSPKYIPNWTVVEALRELIANALDTKTKVSVKFSKGEGVISDQAAGIPRQFWVFGEGNHGEIGQFGEGMKLALLVLARESIPVQLETVGYTVVPTLQHSATFDTTILVLGMLPNSRQYGTEIKVRCQSADFAKAKSLFLVLSHPKWICKRLGVLDEPGALYINGVFVQSGKALWGYNISAKAAANRDRSILDSVMVENNISSMLAGLCNVKMICQLLRAKDADVAIREANLFIYPQRRHFWAWKKATRIVYGKKVCFSEGGVEVISALASQRGWNVLAVNYCMVSLLRQLGIKSVRDVLTKGKGPVGKRRSSPLSQEEQIVLRTAVKLAKSIVPDAVISRVRVVETLEDVAQTLSGSGCTILGMYRKKTVYVARERLSSVGKCASTLIHERLHGCGFLDGTTALESALTDAMERLIGERQ